MMMSWWCHDVHPCAMVLR